MSDQLDKLSTAELVTSEGETLAELQSGAGLNDEQVQEVRLSAQRMARGLMGLETSSEELAAALRARRDQRYEQVRQAMEESRANSSVLLDRRLSDFSQGPGASISRELPKLRQRILDLTPGRPTLMRRVMRSVPFAKKGEQEVFRLQSGRSQIQAVVSSLAASRQQLQDDHAELERFGAQLVASVRHLRRELLANLVTRAEVQRALLAGGLDIGRQQVLEQHLLRPLQQEALDLSTQLQVALQALIAKEDIQETGRQLIEAVNRASTTTVAALETGLVLSGVVGDQARVGRMMVDLGETTEKILLENARMIRQNAVSTAALASRPLIRVEVLTKAADTIEEGRREVEALRANQGRELERNLQQLKTLIERSNKTLEFQGDSLVLPNPEPGKELR